MFARKHSHDECPFGKELFFFRIGRYLFSGVVVGRPLFESFRALRVKRKVRIFVDDENGSRTGSLRVMPINRTVLSS